MRKGEHAHFNAMQMKQHIFRDCFESDFASEEISLLSEKLPEVAPHEPEARSSVVARCTDPSLPPQPADRKLGTCKSVSSAGLPPAALLTWEERWLFTSTRVFLFHLGLNRRGSVSPPKTSRWSHCRGATQPYFIFFQGVPRRVFLFGKSILRGKPLPVLSLSLIHHIHLRSNYLEQPRRCREHTRSSGAGGHRQCMWLQEPQACARSRTEGREETALPLKPGLP